MVAVVATKEAAEEAEVAVAETDHTAETEDNRIRMVNHTPNQGLILDAPDTRMQITNGRTASSTQEARTFFPTQDVAEDVVEAVVDDLTIVPTTKINRTITNNKTVANDWMNTSEMIQINATIIWPWSVRNNYLIEQCVTTILVFLPDQEIIATTMVTLTINHVG